MGVGDDTIVVVKKNRQVFERIKLRTLQRIGQDDITLCRRENMLPGYSPLIAIGYKYNYQKAVYFVTTEDSGRESMVLPIYLIALTIILMLQFATLLVSLSCKSYLYLLMRLKTKTNPSSLIQHWKKTGLLSVVGYGF